MLANLFLEHAKQNIFKPANNMYAKAHVNKSSVEKSNIVTGNQREKFLGRMLFIGDKVLMGSIITTLKNNIKTALIKAKI